MKKNIAFLLISIFLVSCQSKIPNIFENPVCEAPCWQDITPGITTKLQAITILDKLEVITKPVIDTNEPYDGYDDILNFTLFNDINNYGFIYIFNDKVSLIGFEYKLGITLQKAIEIIGRPKYIMILQSGEIYAAIFIEPQKGFAYNYFLKDRAIEIKPDSEISDLTFFDPDTYQLLLDSEILSYHQLSGEETIQKLHSWEGYGVISQYR